MHNKTFRRVYKKEHFAPLLHLSLCSQAVLAWLAAQPAVHWLAPRLATRLHNWNGVAVTQSGALPGAPPELVGQGLGTHPLWAAGLTGAGEVVGAGDSGIGE